MDRDKVSVGTSRKWEAKEAGEEVGKNTLSDLDGDPTFFLLFSSIHYEEYGGFESLLEGVWEVLPEETPLVGGVVTGFLNNSGVYSRGVTGMAVSYENMDVAVAKGDNTKRNPEGAGKNCMRSINKQLEDSDYENRLLFDITAGFKIPEVPGFPRKSVIKSGILSSIMFRGVKFFKFLGEEESTLKSVKREGDEFYMLHGSSMDDFRAKKHYQFFGRDVVEDSIVALGISTDFEIDGKFAHGLSPGKKFDATKISNDKRFLEEINGKPASEEITQVLDWPKDFLSEKNIHRTATYSPIGFIDEEGDSLPRPFTFILGNRIGLMSSFESDKGCVLRGSGESMANAVKDLFKGDERPLLPFVSCAVRFLTLGKRCWKVKEKIQKGLNNFPFLIIYTAGEALRKPRDDIKYLNESVAATTFREGG